MIIRFMKYILLTFAGEASVKTQELNMCVLMLPVQPLYFCYPFKCANVLLPTSLTTNLPIS